MKIKEEILWVAVVSGVAFLLQVGAELDASVFDNPDEFFKAVGIGFVRTVCAAALIGVRKLLDKVNTNE